MSSTNENDENKPHANNSSTSSNQTNAHNTSTSIRKRASTVLTWRTLFDEALQVVVKELLMPSFARFSTELQQVTECAMREIEP
jgi:hypothetical protein